MSTGQLISICRSAYLVDLDLLLDPRYHLNRHHPQGGYSIFGSPRDPLKIDAKTVPQKCPKWSPKGAPTEVPNRQNVVLKPSQKRDPKKHPKTTHKVLKKVSFPKAPTWLNHNKYWCFRACHGLRRDSNKLPKTYPKRPPT